VWCSFTTELGNFLPTRKNWLIVRGSLFHLLQKMSLEAKSKIIKFSVVAIVCSVSLLAQCGMLLYSTFASGSSMLLKIFSHSWLLELLSIILFRLMSYLLIVSLRSRYRHSDRHCAGDSV
jgi:hypothetical protein